MDNTEQISLQSKEKEHIVVPPTENEVSPAMQIQETIRTISSDLKEVASTDDNDPDITVNTDKLLTLAVDTQTAINQVANEGNIVIDNSAVGEPLRIEPGKWKDWEFTKWGGEGAIEQLLKGEITQDELAGKEISPEFEALVNQIRPLRMEVNSGFAVTENKAVQYQVTPSVGTEESVNSGFVSSPEGTITFDIHNHPSEGNATYPYFSGGDLHGALNFPSTLNNQVYGSRAVVFEEGVAILVKTPETQQIIEKMSNGGKTNRDRSNFRDELDKRVAVREPKDQSDRQAYNVDICREFHMGLYFVPKGEKTIQTVYNPNQQPTAKQAPRPQNIAQRAVGFAKSVVARK